jgi:hypothetical protein
LRVVNNTITNNRELAVAGSHGGKLDWLLTVPPKTFAGAAASDNNRNPVTELSWSGNTLTGNGAGYTSTPPWPSDHENANNQWTSTGTFLSPGNMPSVSINVPSLAIVGQLVQFSLHYSGHDPLASVLWDLGDGLPTTTSNATYTYSDPGTCRIGLVVWDSLGRAAHDERSLVIYPAVPGDANSDGKVDTHDASILGAYWQRQSGATWAMGDFNSDGRVDDRDAAILGAYWHYGVGEASVPEPTVLASILSRLTTCAVGIVWHQRQKRA